ncbi:CAP domain-containing protein [Streptacidiphilus neutrinimicus]|uniref:CAP domain-containing protein n=1 Tax=Streptacidiphilus neutrinimicus TaxID=105420 RepID=UPI0006932B2B|nr:CAP domain-containing protein [Streptacidiphilus neutrinimicus]
MDWQTDWQGTEETQGQWAGPRTGRRASSRRAAHAGSRHRKRARWSVTPLVAAAAVVCAGAVGAVALSPAASRGPVGNPQAAPAAGPTTAVDSADGASAAASSSGSASASASASPTPSVRVTPAHSATPRSMASSAPSRPTGASNPGGSNSQTPGATSGSAPAVSGPGSSYAVQQVLAVINQARAQAGLPAYTITSGLTASAGAHNAVMMGGCGLSHQCPGEADLGTRITDAGVHWGACGENIGEGGPMADTDAAIAQMAVGLTQSMLAEQPPNDGHRRNILSSAFHHIGIVVQRTASGTVYMTQDFSD